MLKKSKKKLKLLKYLLVLINYTSNKPIKI